MIGLLGRFWYVPVILLLILALGAQQWRVDRCQKSKLQLEIQVAALGETIAVQNRAVEALRREGEAKVSRAAQEARRAKEETAGARTEAERLKRLAASQSTPSACPAGDAVSEIRRGLK